MFLNLNKLNHSLLLLFALCDVEILENILEHNLLVFVSQSVMIHQPICPHTPQGYLNAIMSTYLRQLGLCCCICKFLVFLERSYLRNLSFYRSRPSSLLDAKVLYRMHYPTADLFPSFPNISGYVLFMITIQSTINLIQGLHNVYFSVIQTHERCKCFLPNYRDLSYRWM